MKLILAATLIILIPILAIAIGPSYYQEVGYLPQEIAVDAVASADQACLLLGNAVAVVDRNVGGLKLQPDSPLALQRVYDRAELAGDWLYLTDSLGFLAVGHLFDNGLQILTETRISDSVFATAAAGRYLYLAAGYFGLNVVDAGQRNNPKVIETLQIGVRYTDLLLVGDLLFAVDRLNGFEIYRTDADSLVYLRRVTTTRPIESLAFSDPYILLSFGDTLIQRVNLSERAEIVGIDSLYFGKRTQRIAAAGGQLVIAYTDASLALVDPISGATSDSLQLPYAISHLRVSTDSLSLFLTDELGLVHEIALAQGEFGRQREVNLSGRIAAMLAADNVLYTAPASGGIAATTFAESGGIDRDLLAGGDPVAALAHEGESLLAATNGHPGLDYYSVSSGRLTPIDHLGWQLPTQSLMLQERESNQRMVIVGIGTGGAQSAEIVDGQLASKWTLPTAEKTVAGFWTGEVLALLSDHWRLQTYSTDSSLTDPVIASEFSLPESTRTMLYLPSGYLATAGSYGVSVYRFNSEFSELDWIRNFSSVRDIYDLAYDPKEQVLVAAAGDAGSFYVDFSDPEFGSTAFPIIGLRGVGRAAASGDYLYLLATDGIHGYLKASAIAPAPIALPQDLSISQNYPNPFNAATSISIVSPAGHTLAGEIDFSVYNILGQRVWRRRQPVSGAAMTLRWDGRGQDGARLASGLYLLVVEAGDFSATRKAVLLK